MKTQDQTIIIHILPIKFPMVSHSMLKEVLLKIQLSINIPVLKSILEMNYLKNATKDRVLSRIRDIYQ